MDLTSTSSPWLRDDNLIYAQSETGANLFSIYVQNPNKLLTPTDIDRLTQLMFAAPDLLEACKLAQSALLNETHRMAAFKALEAAIAKATPPQITEEPRENDEYESPREVSDEENWGRAEDNQ